MAFINVMTLGHLFLDVVGQEFKRLLLSAVSNGVGIYNIYGDYSPQEGKYYLLS